MLLGALIPCFSCLNPARSHHSITTHTPVADTLIPLPTPAPPTPVTPPCPSLPIQECEACAFALRDNPTNYCNIPACMPYGSLVYDIVKALCALNPASCSACTCGLRRL